MLWQSPRDRKAPRTAVSATLAKPSTLATSILSLDETVFESFADDLINLEKPAPVSNITILDPRQLLLLPGLRREKL